MTVRSVCLVAFTLVTIGSTAPAEAQGWKDSYVGRFMSSVARDTKRRCCWPKPFVCPDRYAARAPFALMVSKGWERQNMLGDHHFEAGSGQLTEAGRLKVRWIITEAPRQHREIYVHKAQNSHETAVRIDNVRRLTTELLPSGQLAAVLETEIPDRGWPAERVDMIGRKFRDSLPDPVLPAGGGTGE